ncbi:hypothetical protein CIPAW_13G110800 [Carya illinoinensis]|uniref:Uncharacterized protein n=1 Tax=Carya illinoinensis TaxID=32201 RepID=A0A8T1NRB6_CARIL|nr:hypothetical protein CIPAW_13G110800 [Carya illinoinensis]
MLGEGNTYWSWEMVKHLYFRIVVEVSIDAAPCSTYSTEHYPLNHWSG